MNRVLLSLSKMVILILAISVSAHTQQSATNTPNKAFGLEVQVKTHKTLYTMGEPIRFTILLTNKGASSVYIAKSFFASGGGIAGFSLSVRQVKGTPSAECPVYADRFGSAGSRSAKQILKEDFLLLAPGGIVGYAGRYQGCAVKYDGTYELTATYCPCDLNTATVASDAKEDDRVIAESIRSKPWIFKLQPRKQ